MFSKQPLIYSVRSKIELRINYFFARLGLSSKPDFIIVGAQKAGTTGLHNTLKQHTYLAGSSKKEINYFSNKEQFTSKNLDEYHAHFPLSWSLKKNTKVFESTPIYLFHPEVPKRLFEYNSKLKLILVLRNPSERAFSAWTMYHHHFKDGEFHHLNDKRTFAKAIEEELTSINDWKFEDDPIAYVRRGIYHEQIARLYEYFPKEQILILESKEVAAWNEDTSKKIQSFLEVPFERILSQKKNSAKVNERSKYVEQFNLLKDFYVPHNERLFSLIDQRFNW